MVLESIKLCLIDVRGLADVTHASDAQAIEVAQSEMGIRVGVFNPHPRNRRSRRLKEVGCLFYRQIPNRALEGSQLPDVVYDRTGPIRKPRGW